MPIDRSALESDVRRLSAAGSTTQAATAAIRAYGPEIYGFLVAYFRGDQEAEEVFSVWSERLFLGFAEFSWECSLRTWAYTIARNAASNHVRGQRNRARRNLPLPESTELSRLEQEVRTETRPYQRTEAKDKLARIRDSLPPEERMLLVLRVDKQLEWKDLARVMLGEDASPTPDALTKEAQRLRKRFQLLKEKLVELARKEGMLGGGES